MNSFWVKYLIAFPILILWLTGCATQPEKPAGNWKLHYRLGTSYFMQKKYPQAVAELNRALALKPDEPRVMDALGLVFYARQDLSRAMSYFRKVLEIDPKFSQTHNNLGSIYWRLGRWDEAIREFSLALADPIYLTPEAAYNNRGVAYLAQGKLDAAVQDFRRAVDVKPDFGQARHNLGLALLRRNRVGEAINQLEFALKVGPVTPRMRLNLAQAYLRNNQRSKAVQQLTRVVDDASDAEIAGQARALLDRLNKD